MTGERKRASDGANDLQDAVNATFSNWAPAFAGVARVAGSVPRTEVKAETHPSRQARIASGAGRGPVALNAAR